MDPTPEWVVQTVKTEVDKILKNETDAPLRSLARLYCEKAFAAGMLKGIEVSKEEYNKEISNLKDEIWELKREIQILS